MGRFGMSGPTLGLATLAELRDNGMNLWKRMFGIEESKQTVIPLEMDVGEYDQVVLITPDHITIEHARLLQEAWQSAGSAQKPIVLSGDFQLFVLRGVNKPKSVNQTFVVNGQFDKTTDNQIAQLGGAGLRGL